MCSVKLLVLVDRDTYYVVQRRDVIDRERECLPDADRGIEDRRRTVARRRARAVGVPSCASAYLRECVAREATSRTQAWTLQVERLAVEAARLAAGGGAGRCVWCGERHVTRATNNNLTL